MFDSHSRRRLLRRSTVGIIAAAVGLFTAVAAAPSAQATTGATGQIIGSAGKCLDAANGSNAPGTVVDMWDCNGTGAQNWYQASDGTLRLGGSGGSCIDASTTSAIQLQSCTPGSGAQHWQPQPQNNNALYNPQSGQCLDVPSNHPSNGTQLDVYGCNQSQAQQWNLPTGQALSVAGQGSLGATLGVATGVRPRASGGYQPYQWSATGLPAGMSINYADGTVQGAPTTTGSYTTILTATDLRGATASTTFTWTVSSPATGTAWYMDCSAGSNGSGTKSSPWNALSSANAHHFAPGDSLLLRRGVTCKGQLAPLGSGTATAPITIDAYGSGTAPLVSGNVAGSVAVSGGSSVGGGAVQLTNQSYWIIQNLEVTNHSATAAQRTGIDVLVTDTNEHDGITIRNNNVHDVTGVSAIGNDYWLSHGIGVDTQVDGGFVKGLTISGNYIHDGQSQGVGVYGTQGDGNNANTAADQYVLVTGNTVERVSNDGIVVCASDAPLVEHNVADALGVNQTQASNMAGIWGWGDNNPTFQFNEVSNISATGIYDGEAWDCDGYITGTCTYQDNYDHDNSGGILLDCTGCGGAAPTKIVFRHNMSVNDCRIITNPGNLASTTFVNNTIDCRSKSWVQDSANSAPYALYENNIFIEPSGTAMASGPYYLANTYVGFPAPGADGQASTADPKLVTAGSGAASYGITTQGGYQLLAGSPALNSGTVIPNWGQEVPPNDGGDLWGNPSSGTPNRGAYAAVGVGTASRSDDGAASYTGSWATAGCSSCYGGGNHYTNSAGAVAQFTATGSTISIYASQTNDNGVAQVSIDGGPAVNVNLYTPGPSTFGQLVYTSPRLSSGSHTVTFTCSGRSDPRSGGTYVSLDSFTAAS